MTVALAITPEPARIIDMRDAHIEDLRDQLADARTDRDRYIARCAELELRLQQIREVVR